MKPGPEQLLLDLPHRVASGRDDFLVTQSNAAAVALIDQFPQWPTFGAVIVGPPGCGKSHLVEVWRTKCNATVIEAMHLRGDAVPQVFNAHTVAIENLGAGPADERALFHALNLARQEAKHILFTAQRTPSLLNFEIPDLASRLNALPVIHIAPPDDELLRGVLVKLFMDRQLKVDDGLISYILLRMPRSLADARQLVAAVDRLAMQDKAAISKQLVAKVLAEISTPDMFN